MYSVQCLSMYILCSSLIALIHIDIRPWRHFVFGTTIIFFRQASGKINKSRVAWQETRLSRASHAIENVTIVSQSTNIPTAPRFCPTLINTWYKSNSHLHNLTWTHHATPFSTFTQSASEKSCRGLRGWRNGTAGGGWSCSCWKA